ncbi:MAG: hypothetical protein GVY35_08830 [Bacteroidetes bacterium]|jgi:hypothetical protein|nr:hypothetical protein [Bacteroidota bacterium]
MPSRSPLPTSPETPNGLLALVLVGLVVMTSCDVIHPEAPPFALRIETDRDQYNVTRDSIIQVAIHNTSGDTLYYNSCIGTTMEVLNGWRVANRIGLPTCFCLCRRTLAPGQSMPPGVSNVSIRAITRNDDRLSAPQSAAFRLIYGEIYRDKAWKDPLARSERRSNRFEL